MYFYRDYDILKTRRKQKWEMFIYLITLLGGIKTLDQVDLIVFYKEDDIE